MSLINLYDWLHAYNSSNPAKRNPLACFGDHLRLTVCDRTCESSQPTCLVTGLITLIITQIPRYNPPLNKTYNIVSLVTNQTSLARLNDY